MIILANEFIKQNKRIIVSRLKEKQFIICTNLNSHDPRMFVPTFMFGWNWFSGSGEKILIEIVSRIIREECGHLHEQTRIISTEECFVPDVVVLARWFWRVDFLNVVHVFSLSPLQKVPPKCHRMTIGIGVLPIWSDCC